MRGDQGRRGKREGGCEDKGNMCWMNKDASVGFSPPPGLVYMYVVREK